MTQLTANKSTKFVENAHRALNDERLQSIFAHVEGRFVDKRLAGIARFPDFEQTREEAIAIKNHVLSHLDIYLNRFEESVSARGGKVHWAGDAAKARSIILEICKKSGAKTATKSKSMISEEVGLNAALEEAGVKPIETDLGEYIIQLRREAPSHIIAPAVHLNKQQVADDFREHHKHLPSDRPLTEPTDLLNEARSVLRQAYSDADVGITGANFLVAETGSAVLVTNEGNADLTNTLPKVHIVLASIEKIVPTQNDAIKFLRLLARSATGQDMSVYTTFVAGPRQENDPDGPAEFHVVLLDNGRSAMLGSEFQDMLRCIRCGACMNHCPVYLAIGGHAYGWVYPGPMGSVLSPSLTDIEKSGHLPNASTFCGRCESVCPMGIPLPKLMRFWRQKQFERSIQPWQQRLGLKLWSALATRPGLYQFLARIDTWFGFYFAGKKGYFRWLPFTGGWTKYRDLAAPERSNTFYYLWKIHNNERKN